MLHCVRAIAALDAVDGAVGLLADRLPEFTVAEDNSRVIIDGVAVGKLTGADPTAIQLAASGLTEIVRARAPGKQAEPVVQRRERAE